MAVARTAKKGGVEGEFSPPSNLCASTAVGSHIDLNQFIFGYK